MSAAERFTDEELALIAAAFGDGGIVYHGAHLRTIAGEPVPHVRCDRCDRAVPVVPFDDDDDARYHAPTCAGVARRRVAAKARALQQGAGGGR